ncbi:MAG: hypothetical protein ACYC62_09000, partial [Coriobacteriia bacterium]
PRDRDTSRDEHDREKRAYGPQESHGTFCPLAEQQPTGHILRGGAAKRTPVGTLGRAIRHGIRYAPTVQHDILTVTHEPLPR